MAINVPAYAHGFAQRLREHTADAMVAFVEAEIISGRPFIFNSDGDLAKLQETIATALGIKADAPDIVIVGSARTGFSLNPDHYFEPFRDGSDIDVAVIHRGLFDEAWNTMLSWDYLTRRSRGAGDRDWLTARRKEVWSGWYHPGAWQF